MKPSFRVMARTVVESSPPLSRTTAFFDTGYSLILCDRLTAGGNVQGARLRSEPDGSTTDEPRCRSIGPMPPTLSGTCGLLPCGQRCFEASQRTAIAAQ